MALIDKLVAIADAIRSKTGGTDPMTLDEMAVAVEGIQTGGGADHTNEDGLITGTLTEYTNDRVESINEYALYDNTNLTSVSFPKLKSISNSAFCHCNALKTIYFPNVTSIGSSAFSSSRIEKAEFPLVTSIGSSAFSNSLFLKKIDFPLVTSLGGYCFEYCSDLTTAILGGCSLPAKAFYYCSNFTTLVLKGATVTNLTNVNALGTTPFATNGTGGTVYCPAALIEQYQTATNWSTLYAAGTCNFVAIEGSEYE